MQEQAIESEPRVVRARRRRTRARRHGGAWKVAFADFVTAMMALFMVLWLWTAGEDAQHAVSAISKIRKDFER